MRAAFIGVALALLVSSLAGAQEATKSAEKPVVRPQAEKMKACNLQAKEQSLKGEERKAFMSQCLRSEKKS